MAINPQARLLTVTYPKGTFTAPKGLIDFLFGTNGARLSWLAPVDPADPITGRRRRKYGTRQRNSARAGEQIRLVMNNGAVYSGRITGTHTAFVDHFLSVGGADKVLNAYSERGTIYGPQPNQAAVPAGSPS